MGGWSGGPQAGYNYGWTLRAVKRGVQQGRAPPLQPGQTTTRPWDYAAALSLGEATLMKGRALPVPVSKLLAEPLCPLLCSPSKALWRLAPHPAHLPHVR